MTEPRTKIGDLVWHIHHEMLLEPLEEPFETRVKYIKATKRAYEVPIRLRLMKPVQEGNLLLPFLAKAQAKVARAYANANKAHIAWDAAFEGQGKRTTTYDSLDKVFAKLAAACDERDKARVQWAYACSDPRVFALHKKECPNCPWNGRTIFP